MDNDAVAALLAEAALLMELEGENAFKVRSYRKAAEAIAAAGADLEALAAGGSLQTLPGIGKSIASELQRFFEAGTLPVLEALRARVPAGLLEMTRIRGLGPARIRAIHQALGIATLGELEYACLENRLAALRGFGGKTQERVLKELDRLKAGAGRFHIHYALRALDEMAAFARGLPGVAAAEVSGEARRRCETVRSGCMVLSAADPAAALSGVLRFGGVRSIEDRAETRARAVLARGLPADVFAAAPGGFAEVLLKTTGSAEHLAELGALAARRGLALADGAFGGAAEEAVYAALGLPFIAPELREGRGEVAAAADGTLPKLVERSDLRGVLHVHTTWSDGHESLAAMAAAAQARGFEYLGIADHSRSAGYAGGLSAERLAEQGAAINELNETLAGFRVLRGVESDILPDGSLDYEQDVLARLDFVVASVHGSFAMEREKMTQRIITAMENPMTRVLGHPTGRLLLARDPYEVDVGAVLDAAARLGVMIEINANPYRLDLDWRHLGRCRELGLKVLINPDAHDIAGLDDVEYGIGVARKGWLGRDTVANCLPAEELLALWARK